MERLGCPMYLLEDLAVIFKLLSLLVSERIDFKSAVAQQGWCARALPSFPRSRTVCGFLIMPFLLCCQVVPVALDELHDTG
jgi:hypothetical protein